MGTRRACADPTTWLSPEQVYLTEDSQYGQVQVRAWHAPLRNPAKSSEAGSRGLRPLVRGTLILVEVECLPNRTRLPKQLWLWWHGPELPDLSRVWRAQVDRFKLEHTLRFVKQFLNWTLPWVRHPVQADRLPLAGGARLYAAALGSTSGR